MRGKNIFFAACLISAALFGWCLRGVIDGSESRLQTSGRPNPGSTGSGAIRSSSASSPRNGSAWPAAVSKSALTYGFTKVSDPGASQATPTLPPASTPQSELAIDAEIDPATGAVRYARAESDAASPSASEKSADLPHVDIEIDPATGKVHYIPSPAPEATRSPDGNGPGRKSTTGKLERRQ